MAKGGTVVGEAYGWLNGCADAKTWKPTPAWEGRFSEPTLRPSSASIVAIPDRAELDARIRTTALAAPFAAGATLAMPVVTMPATRPALA